MKQRPRSKRTDDNSQDNSSMIALIDTSIEVDAAALLHQRAKEWADIVAPVCDAEEYKGIGRKSLLVAETAGTYLAAISMGNTLTTAAELANVSYDTVTRWNDNPDFAEILKSAKAQWKNALVSRIMEAGKRTWTADAWLLERGASEEWGRHLTIGVNHSGEVLHTHRLDATPILSTTEYAGVLDQTLRALAPPPLDTTYRSIDDEVITIPAEE